jgi:DNA modification methylase
MSKSKDGQTSKPQPKLEQIHPADLIPYARNAKKHDPEQVAKIAGSIREFGFNNPVLIDQSNGIIAGHGRVMAAIKLGLESVPVIRLSHLTETQRRAYILADNKLAELGGGWDEEMLKVELEAIKESDLDHLLTGFSDEEMDQLLAETNKLNGDPDEVPEPPADPITKPGDLWILGEHRLLCGDSTKAADVERLMAGAKADLLLTDPPYGVDYEGITNDDAAGLPRLLAGAFQNADAIMQHGACYYVCHPDVHAYEFVGAIRGVGWKQARPPVVLWIKDRFVLGRGDYHSQSEPILYGWKEGAAHHAVEDRSQSNLWEFPRPAAADGHPTMKPVGLFARAMQNSTNQKASIYEPFCGSGTTLIAAEQLGRKCYGMEISPAYCDVIVKRWETLTGKKATRESDVL